MQEILLVEDLESDARLTERTLRKAGIRNAIRHVWGVAEALLYLTAVEKGDKDSSPAILLLDLKMPQRSGFDILGWMQGRQAFCDTLRIVLTQLDDLHSIRRAYSLGAHSFLTKPPRASDLKELVKAFPRHWQVSGRRPVRPTVGSLAIVDNAASKLDTNAVFAQNRQIIERLRADLDALKEHLSDNEQTFAVIDLIVSDFRDRNRVDFAKPLVAEGASASSIRPSSKRILRKKTARTA
jgi:CheY-like chemotaxis protein